MKKELGISAAIIGGSVLVALVIAGGPSGFTVQDDTTAVTTTESPLSTEPDQADPTGTSDPAEAVTTVPDADIKATTTTTSRPGITTTTTTTSAPRSSTSAVTTTSGGPSTTLVDDDTLLPRSDLNVAVANGAGLAGIADLQTDKVAGFGYLNPTPVNSEPFLFTVVFFPPELEAEAARLATDFGLPDTSKLPFSEMPTLSVPNTFDLVLMLGGDLRPPTG